MFLVSAMMFLVLQLHLPVSDFSYVVPVYADMFQVSEMMFLVDAETSLVSAEMF
jgi:hypothetical protein